MKSLCKHMLGAFQASSFKTVRGFCITAHHHPPAGTQKNTDNNNLGDTALDADFWGSYKLIKSLFRSS